MPGTPAGPKREERDPEDLPDIQEIIGRILNGE
jgi:hypothetical protein